MSRRYGTPVKLPEIAADCTPAERDKYSLNFYNHKFLLALEDVRARWHIEVTDMTEFNDWNETIMNCQEFRDELVHLASLLPSTTYYRFWIILITAVFSPTIGWLAPYLAYWAKYFRGDYDITTEHDKYGEYVEVKIFAQLAREDWKELIREARNRSHKLERKSLRKKDADDLRMLAVLANLARDEQRRLSFGQLATELSNLGYTDKHGRLFSNGEIEGKLKEAHRLGF